MDWQNEKCVMVIDESLPLGIITNTAAIMGITLGKKMPEVVGTTLDKGIKRYWPDGMPAVRFSTQFAASRWWHE